MAFPFLKQVSASGVPGTQTSHEYEIDTYKDLS